MLAVVGAAVEALPLGTVLTIIGLLCASVIVSDIVLRRCWRTR